ncbi:transglutaminase-like cysteine peptidase [Sinorhizobium sp. BG8]|uniref:transglutaminase-like cysteine peptidase n=1 Tax=Sinorhizobium sp. BG8 TaxID=2613773 RepID=UPI001FEDCACD|nr:transglutaminase-like cysteine peptidase [Sinorhizobium sp. BG8]
MQPADVYTSARSIAARVETAIASVEPAGWAPSATGRESRKESIARPAVKPAKQTAVFGSVAIPFKRLAAVKRLAPSLDQIAEGGILDCRTGCSAAVESVRAARTSTEGKVSVERLQGINAAVNHAIRYSRDIENYRTADRWATPLETLKRQAGDCEDLAILKMAVLEESGYAMKDMAIVVLFDRDRKFYHAVLSVHVDDQFFILDNMRDAVLTDRELASYLPLYSIADGKGFLHGSRQPGSPLLAENAIPLESVAPGEGLAN